MPAIVLSLSGGESRFEITKLERSRIYGRRRRIPLDPSGAPCTRASLSADGSLLIRAGMTAQGWFDAEGRQVDADKLSAVDMEGRPVPTWPSTLGKPVDARPAQPRELLDTRVELIYMLEPAEVDPDLAQRLAAGEIFSFPFVFRAGPTQRTAFLVQNEAGAFLLAGQPVDAPWCELAVPPPVSGDEGLDDELDFEMF